MKRIAGKAAAKLQAAAWKSAVAGLAGARIAGAAPFGASQVEAGGAFLSIFFPSSFSLRDHCARTRGHPYGLRTMVRIKPKMPTRSAGSPKLRAWVSKPSAITSAAGCWRSRRGRRVRYAATVPRDLKRLRFIRSASAAGFTLNEIKELVDLDASDDRARARGLRAGAASPR